jgi:molybdenum cofactor synthesis domain-containing protein
MPAPGVAAVIIGNEVLTAKVVEANGSHLVKRARERGLRVTSVHFVPDEVDDIVEAVMLARRRAALVITSGGVGPTHDDVTVRAVSLALGRRVERVPRLEQLLREAWGATPPPPEALRMAEAPAGSTLLDSADTRFPVVGCDGVWLLPGVPELFRLQLEPVLALLPGAPVTLAVLYLSARESDIAHALDAAARELPDVAFGSYPTFDHASKWRVKLTIEHQLAARVAEAVARLERALPAGCIVDRG